MIKKSFVIKFLIIVIC